MEKYLAKLPIEQEKLQKYMEVISKYSFAVGLFIELTIVLLDKSAYIIQYEGWWFRITFLLFGLSLITTKRDLKQWIWLGIFGVIGVISYRATGRNEILRWVVFIWACHGKDMKKVLKFTFWYTLVGCAVIVLLSVLGIYGEVLQTAVYRTEQAWTPGEEEIRYCFGMGHPNAFHCMVLVLTWLGIYCYHEKIKWFGYIAIGFLHIIVYLFTDSRTGLIMSIASLGLAGILQYIKGLQKVKLPYIVGIMVVIGGVAFSVFMAKYSVMNPVLAKIDTVLTNRILNLYYGTINHEGMLHTWSLWSESRNNYFFDLGIVRFFYWFGIIPGVLYFLAQCRLIWCSYKRTDYMLSVMIMLVTIYSIFEAHFVSDYMGRNYILFFFGMYLSDMIDIRHKSDHDLEQAKNIK